MEQQSKVDSVLIGLREIETGDLYVNNIGFSFASVFLRALWSPLPEKEAPTKTRKFKQRAAERRLPISEERASYESGTRSEWYVGMSKEFVKNIQNIDRKLQGRILEALSKICSDPITPKGDTVKPLTSELKGLWRYRLGDFRLVYRPDMASKRIMLVTFDSRGSVYE